MNRLATGLPGAGDPRWRVAPRTGTEKPTRFLPFAPPFVPRTGQRLRWLRAVRLVLLEDGFPGRLRDGSIVVHALDGRYLLEALMAEQAAHPRRRLHPAILRTAEAIIGRADRSGDALVMTYTDTASSLAAGRPHASALAQAYYAAALAEAGTLLGSRTLLHAADAFFAPVLRPVNHGGTLYRSGNDVIPALVPARPRDLVLNGWLSTLVAVDGYAARRDSDAARQLLRDSARTLARFLPRYDVPNLHLSRYGLTGPLLLRIGLSGGAVGGVRFSRLRVAIPGEGEQRLPSRSAGRWSNRAYPEDAAVELDAAGKETLIPHARGLRLVAVLSRAPFPRANRLRFTIRTPRELTATITAHIGRYDPGTSATVDRGWVTLGTRALHRGANVVDLELPYEEIDLFAYPTNFTRGGPGTKVNTYHGTHIVRLRQLATATGRQELLDWADRWMGYVDQWSMHPSYADGVCWTPEGEL